MHRHREFKQITFRKQAKPSLPTREKTDISCGYESEVELSRLIKSTSVSYSAAYRAAINTYVSRKFDVFCRHYDNHLARRTSQVIRKVESDVTSHGDLRHYPDVLGLVESVQSLQTLSKSADCAIIHIPDFDLNLELDLPCSYEAEFFDVDGKVTCVIVLKLADWVAAPSQPAANDYMILQRRLISRNKTKTDDEVIRLYFAIEGYNPTVIINRPVKQQQARMRAISLREWLKLENAQSVYNGLQFRKLIEVNGPDEFLCSKWDMTWKAMLVDDPVLPELLNLRPLFAALGWAHTLNGDEQIRDHSMGLLLNGKLLACIKTYETAHIHPKDRPGYYGSTKGPLVGDGVQTELHSLMNFTTFKGRRTLVVVTGLPTATIENMDDEDSPCMFDILESEQMRVEASTTGSTFLGPSGASYIHIPPFNEYHYHVISATDYCDEVRARYNVIAEDTTRMFWAVVNAKKAHLRTAKGKDPKARFDVSCMRFASATHRMATMEMTSLVPMMCLSMIQLFYGYEVDADILNVDDVDEWDRPRVTAIRVVGYLYNELKRLENLQGEEKDIDTVPAKHSPHRQMITMWLCMLKHYAASESFLIFKLPEEYQSDYMRQFLRAYETEPFIRANFDVVSRDHITKGKTPEGEIPLMYTMNDQQPFKFKWFDVKLFDATHTSDMQKREKLRKVAQLDDKGKEPAVRGWDNEPDDEPSQWEKVNRKSKPRYSTSVVHSSSSSSSSSYHVGSSGGGKKDRRIASKFRNSGFPRLAQHQD